MEKWLSNMKEWQLTVTMLTAIGLVCTFVFYMNSKDTTHINVDCRLFHYETVCMSPQEWDKILKVDPKLGM